jgi:hypothetical protein
VACARGKEEGKDERSVPERTTVVAHVANTRRHGVLTVRDEARSDRSIGFRPGGWPPYTRQETAGGHRLGEPMGVQCLATEPMTGGPHASNFPDSRIKPKNNFQCGKIDRN